MKLSPSSTLRSAVLSRKGRVVVEMVPNSKKSVMFVSPSKNSRHNKKHASGPARRSSIGNWSTDEDDLLRELAVRYNSKRWKEIAMHLPGRSSVQCLHRWMKVLNPGLKKGKWLPDEDASLASAVRRFGQLKEPVRWCRVEKFVPGRNGKQCNDRWKTRLRPGLIFTPWTEEEDLQLIFLNEQFPSKWSIMSTYILGRSDNNIKNRWNTYMKKTSRPKTKISLKAQQALQAYYERQRLKEEQEAMEKLENIAINPEYSELFSAEEFMVGNLENNGGFQGAPPLPVVPLHFPQPWEIPPAPGPSSSEMMISGLSNPVAENPPLKMDPESVGRWVNLIDEELAAIDEELEEMEEIKREEKGLEGHVEIMREEERNCLFYKLRPAEERLKSVQERYKYLESPSFDVRTGMYRTDSQRMKSSTHGSPTNFSGIASISDLVENKENLDPESEEKPGKGKVSRVLFSSPEVKRPKKEVDLGAPGLLNLKEEPEKVEEESPMKFQETPILIRNSMSFYSPMESKIVNYRDCILASNRGFLREGDFPEPKVVEVKREIPEESLKTPLATPNNKIFGSLKKCLGGNQGKKEEFTFDENEEFEVEGWMRTPTEKMISDAFFDSGPIPMELQMTPKKRDASALGNESALGYESPKVQKKLQWNFEDEAKLRGSTEKEMVTAPGQLDISQGQYQGNATNPQNFVSPGDHSKMDQALKSPEN